MAKKFFIYAVLSYLCVVALATDGNTLDLDVVASCSAQCDTDEADAVCSTGMACTELEAACRGGICTQRRTSLTSWTDCSVTCGGGTRQVIGTGHTIDCNTQSCTPVEEDCEADVMFLMDSSGSLGWLDFARLKQAVMDIISGLNISPTETRAGSVLFSTTVNLRFDLNEYGSAPPMIADVWAAPHLASNTHMGEAIILGADTLNNQARGDPVPKIMILLTDGKPNGPEDADIAAADAKNSGILLITIGIGEDTDEPQLQSMASVVNGNPLYFFVDNAAALPTLIDFIIELTCSLEPPNDCFRCNYTNGQIWLEDPTNCHLFYVCEPIGNGQYIKHLMTCGELYWDPASHTCVTDPDVCEDINIGLVVTYPQPSTTRAPCPFEVDPINPAKFYPIGHPELADYCLDGLEFIVDPECTCVRASTPICDSDPLLHFPFDDHFNDVNCQKAIGIPWGDATIVNDADRGKVASFPGDARIEVRFIETYFIHNNVLSWTVTVWFKITADGLVSGGGIVNNGDCEEDASFGINAQPAATVNAEINSDGTGHQTTNGVSPIPANTWCFAAWVYDGNNLKFYLSCKNNPFDTNPAVTPLPANGPLTNCHCPMSIGFDDGNYLEGYIDELRVYDRVLDPAELASLY